jgi:hypothetical protein
VPRGTDRHLSKVRRRLAAWARRYLPAEVAGTALALAGAGVAYAVTGDRTVVALVGAWSENLGYYGTIGARDFARARRRVDPAPGAAPLEPNRWRTLREVLAGLLLEFGPAEALDSVVVRPLAMFAAAQVVPEIGAAVLLGKLAADLVFYLPTIVAFELRRRTTADRAEDGAP